MGTDIHGRIQYRYSKETPYSDAGEIEDTRNYRTFAMLAGVRNGYGFAGHYTHDELVPIAETRGLPADVIADESYDIDIPIGWNGEKFKFWLGDHSHSHVFLKEILDWEGWNKELVINGERKGPFREWSPIFRAWVDYLNAKYGYLHENDPEAVRLVFGFDS